MKSILTILIIALAFTCNAQTDSKAQTDCSSALSFSQVVKTDSASRSELYVRARKWFSTTFNDSKSVLNISDKESGELSGKGTMSYTSGASMGGASNGWIDYEITVTLKDGRYKYEITNFVHKGTPQGTSNYEIDMGLITNCTNAPNFKSGIMGEKWRQKVWDDVKQKVTDKSNALIASLNAAMSKPSGSASKDW